MNETVKRGIIARCVLRSIKNAGGPHTQVERRVITHAVTNRKLTAKDLDRYLFDLPDWSDDLIPARRGQAKQVYLFGLSAIETAKAHTADGVMARLAK